MKITIEERNKSITFGDLVQGDIFSKENLFFIKSRDNNGEFAVCLSSGNMREFRYSDDVTYYPEAHMVVTK